MHWIAAHRAPVLTGLASSVLDAAGSLRLLAAVGALVLLLVLVPRARRAAAAAVFAALLAVVVAGVLKDVVGRARPPAGLSLVQVAGASMPSTHAAWTAAASVAALLVVARRSPDGVRARWIALVAAWDAVVGVLMVYLGVHWPTDVLAGWALGAAAGALVAPALAPRPRTR